MHISKIFRAALLISAMIIVLAMLWILGFARVEDIWFIFPIMAIRISTVISAMICFSIVIFLQRANTWKSLYYATLAVIFTMGVYEFVWYNLAVALKGYELRLFPFLALLGWIFLGIREVYPYRPQKISLILYIVYVFSMIIWVVTGFNFNDLGNPNFSFTGELLNITSKAAITIGYSLHLGSKK